MTNDTQWFIGNFTRKNGGLTKEVLLDIFKAMPTTVFAFTNVPLIDSIISYHYTMSGSQDS